jgi:hypothetical protein
MRNHLPAITPRPAEEARRPHPALANRGKLSNPQLNCAAPGYRQSRPGGHACTAPVLRVRGQVLDVRRSLTTVSFGRLNFPGRKATLAAGLAGLVMLLKELRGALMHLGRLVVHDSCMLMGRRVPTLMLLVLVRGFAHQARLSRASWQYHPAPPHTGS